MEIQYLTNLCGWTGNIFFAYGVYALGNKKIIGFYCNSIANLMYVFQSIIMDNRSLFWLSIILIILNIKGIIEWRKQ